MMGFWSLGDYFKKQAIERTIEFLTDEKRLALPKEKIGYGIFGGFKHEGEELIPFDILAKKTLLEQGIEEKHIKPIAMFKGEKCDNFR